MKDEETIKAALVNIAKVLAETIVRDLHYDYHFSGHVTYKNENGTFEIYSEEKKCAIHNVRWSTTTEPVVGDKVLIRETKGVPDSYMIDYVEQ